MSTSAIATVVDSGYCSGCGDTFTGARGLRAHQTRPHTAMACKPLPALQQAAAQITGKALLREFAYLTHRMETASVDARREHRRDRNLVEAEILRRMA